VVNHSKARCREVCNAGMQTRPGERTGVKVLKCVGAAAADAPWRGSKQSVWRKPAGNSNGKLGAEMEKNPEGKCAMVHFCCSGGGLIIASKWLKLLKPIKQVARQRKFSLIATEMRFIKIQEIAYKYNWKIV